MNKVKARTKAIKRWLEGHGESTVEERQVFTTGFNMGWGSRQDLIREDSLNNVEKDPVILFGLRQAISGLQDKLNAQQKYIESIQNKNRVLKEQIARDRKFINGLKGLKKKKVKK